MILTDNKKIRNYVLSGNARFTIYNSKMKDNIEKNSFCFKVQKLRNSQNKNDNRKGQRVFFVRLLFGDHRSPRELYLGTIFIDRMSRAGEFKRTQRSELPTEDSSFQAFDWFWFKLNYNISSPKISEFPEGFEFITAAVCAKCRKPIFTATEITARFGDSCLQKQLFPQGPQVIKSGPQKKRDKAWNKKRLNIIKAKDANTVLNPSPVDIAFNQEVTTTPSSPNVTGDDDKEKKEKKRYLDLF